MFKILNNKAPNPGISFITNERTGIKAEVPQIKQSTKAYIKNMRMNSFGYLGPKLFNILPLHLRNFQESCTSTNITHAFKNQLDKFLATIPDEPTDYNLSRCGNSNSLIDQIYFKSD